VALDRLVGARPGLGILAGYPHDPDDRKSAAPDNDQAHQQDERQLVLDRVLCGRQGEGET
jgi:hypothetical protein